MKGKQLKKNLSSWNAVLDVWKEFKVPFVEVRKFDTKLHYPSLCWVYKVNKPGYIIHTSNPQNDTAWQLVKGIVIQNEEVFTAFAIHAYLIHADHRSDYITREVLSILVRDKLAKVDSPHYGYWHSNAKRVLPYVDIGPNYWEKIESWRDWVEKAARYWIAIANQLAVVRIPNFMDSNSQEYQEWREYQKANEEAEERKLYEQLKNKYGA